MAAETQAETERPRTFYGQLGKAFLYPLTGHGPYVILAWVLCYAFVGLVIFLLGVVLPGPAGGYVAIIPLIVRLVLVGYFCAYLMKVIGSSATGDDQPPNWPAFSSFWDEVFRPLLLLISAVIVSFGPAGVCRTARFYGAPYMDELMWGLFVAGLLYLPMAVLAVALFDSIAALNPVVVVASIVRVWRAYLAACAAMTFVLALSFACITYVVPYVPFFGSLLSGAVVLYFLMGEMRILGLLYFHHEQRLGWFPAR